jgi:hypothetical protein
MIECTSSNVKGGDPKHSNEWSYVADCNIYRRQLAP